MRSTRLAASIGAAVAVLAITAGIAALRPHRDPRAFAVSPVTEMSGDAGSVAAGIEGVENGFPTESTGTLLGVGIVPAGPAVLAGSTVSSPAGPSSTRPEDPVNTTLSPTATVPVSAATPTIFVDPPTSELVVAPTVTITDSAITPATPPQTHPSVTGPPILVPLISFTVNLVPGDTSCGGSTDHLYLAEALWDRQAEGRAPNQLHMGSRVFTIDPVKGVRFCTNPGASYSVYWEATGSLATYGKVPGLPVTPGA